MDSRMTQRQQLREWNLESGRESWLCCALGVSPWVRPALPELILTNIY